MNKLLARYFWRIRFPLLFFFFLLFVLWLYDRSETVLVTGGLGFIGSNLVDSLLSEGYKVVVLDDASTGKNFNIKSNNVIGDITIVQNFARINTRIDYIVHLAAAISVAESVKHPEKYHKINVEGSKNVLEFAVENKVKKVISASSAAVYGVPKTLPVTELSEINPISPYASSKLEMENLQREYYERFDLNSICLRFFNVYGPRQNPKSPYTGVISQFMESARLNKPLKIYGDGKNTRDFVFVKDVANAIIHAIKYGSGFHIYNVGTEDQISIQQLASKIIRVSKSESTIEYFEGRDGDIKDSLSSTVAIRRDLGWQPKVSLTRGLEITFDWLKSVSEPVHEN